MSTVTYRGQIPMGEQERLHLSTNNGLTGYRIKKLQIISSQPGQSSVEFVVQVFLTDQSSSITNTVNFNDPGLIAVAYTQDEGNASRSEELVIFESEIFNQDIFVTAADGAGATTPVNYYLELEKIKLDLNASTISTLKNIRQSKADNL